MRVFGIHDDSGCGWYRIRLPFAEMARHGHEVKCVAGWADVAEAARYDVVVGQRMDKHNALPMWRRLVASAATVYEIDDDIFSVEPVNWMAHRVYSNPVPQDAVIHAAEVADLVTVTTDPLAEVMARYNPRVAVIPNCIPAGLLDVERPRREKIVIGWAGGASHGLDVQEVAPALRRTIDRNRGAEVHLMGTDYSPTVKRACRFTEWSNDPWEYYRSIDFDIGLAPLTWSTFNRSKSHIKALEYAALGIPVVASDAEPYRQFVRDCETGFLIRRPHEWEQRIRALVNDEAMRAEMGAKARQVAAEWTIERRWVEWVAAYETAMGRGVR